MNIYLSKSLQADIEKRKIVLQGKYCPSRKTASSNMAQPIDKSLVNNFI